MSSPRWLSTLKIKCNIRKFPRSQHTHNPKNVAFPTWAENVHSQHRVQKSPQIKSERTQISFSRCAMLIPQCNIKFGAVRDSIKITPKRSSSDSSGSLRYLAFTTSVVPRSFLVIRNHHLFPSSSRVAGMKEKKSAILRHWPATLKSRKLFPPLFINAGIFIARWIFRRGGCI